MSYGFIDGSPPSQGYRVGTQEQDTTALERPLAATDDYVLKQIFTVAFHIHYCNEEWPVLDAHEIEQVNTKTKEVEKSFSWPDDVPQGDRVLRKSCQLKGVLFGLSGSGVLFAWEYATQKFLRRFDLENICDLYLKNDTLYVKVESSSYKKLEFKKK